MIFSIKRSRDKKPVKRFREPAKRVQAPNPRPAARPVTRLTFDEIMDKLADNIAVQARFIYSRRPPPSYDPIAKDMERAFRFQLRQYDPELAELIIKQRDLEMAWLAERAHRTMALCEALSKSRQSSVDKLIKPYKQKMTFGTKQAEVYVSDHCSLAAYLAVPVCDELAKVDFDAIQRHQKIADECLKIIQERRHW